MRKTCNASKYPRENHSSTFRSYFYSQLHFKVLKMFCIFMGENKDIDTIAICYRSSHDKSYRYKEWIDKDLSSKACFCSHFCTLFESFFIIAQKNPLLQRIISPFTTFVPIGRQFCSVLINVTDIAFHQKRIFNLISWSLFFARKWIILISTIKSFCECLSSADRILNSEFLFVTSLTTKNIQDLVTEDL